jgi:predicted flavoprotein YhiN
MAHLARDARRALTHALVSLPLDVTGSRGYRVAEVTAGGVPLEEIDPATMASRRCPGLYLVGEILDVDGRIGGFNFQWAWASGAVAGRAVGMTRNSECGMRSSELGTNSECGVRK